MQLALIIFDTAGLIWLTIAFASLLDQLGRERKARAKAETMTCALCRSQVLIGDYLRHQRWHSQTNIATLYGRHVVSAMDHIDDKNGS